MISRVFSSLSKYGTYPTLRKAVLKIRHSPILNTYSHWIKNFECREINEFISAAGCELQRIADTKFTVIVPVSRLDTDLFGDTVASVQCQSHNNWELICVIDSSNHQELADFLTLRGHSDPRISVQALSACNEPNDSVLKDAGQEFVIFLGQNDMLHPSALECLAVALSTRPQAKLLYTDHDRIDAHQTRFDPYFKPHWSPELLLSQNYVGNLACWSYRFLQEVQGLQAGIDNEVQKHATLLRAAPHLKEKDVFHIPFPLYHHRVVGDPDADSSVETQCQLEVGSKAVADYWAQAMDCRGEPEVIVDPTLNLYHSKVELQNWPEVTLVVPHRDSPSLLKSMLELWTQTDYPRLKLVLVDHSSTDPTAKKMMDELAGTDHVTVSEYKGQFNFSRMCNQGVEHADPNSYICFLNNDVQLLDFGWLKNLVPYLEIPGVVAAGPLLLYPDFSIQHAGIALGIGGFAGHYFKHLPYGAPSYQHWAYSARNTSALTGAALLTRRSDFESVGGFDEKDFPTSFSDVDLCLKLSKRGRLVYCPDSKLIHLESQTRPKTDDIENIQRLRRKWHAEIDADTYFPTIFSRLTESMTPNYRTLRPFR
jgi:GT2 family glycosyltransferase